MSDLLHVCVCTYHMWDDASSMPACLSGRLVHLQADWREDAKAELRVLGGLNSSQRRAVAEALVHTLTLWQGPPGTGKTRTLLALMQVLVRVNSATPARWSGAGPLLACAGTNAAVDNLLEGLEARGIQAVRVGPPAKVCRRLTLG